MLILGREKNPNLAVCGRNVNVAQKGLWGKSGLGANQADIVHAVASIPKTFMLGIRDKRSEAGKAFGCLV